MLTIVGSNKVMCYAQAINLTYWNVAIWLWIAVIGCAMYLIIVKRLTNIGKFLLGSFFTVTAEYEKYFHLLCWGTPALISVIMGMTGVIGDTGPWCWITADHVVYRFALFYGWLVLAWIVDFVFLGLTAYCILKPNKMKQRLK
jgi:hypothetical protein